MSFLELEGLHVFVTGAAGGIGSAIVEEFLAQGCKVTAHDLKSNNVPDTPSLLHLQGDISSEPAISSSIAAAVSHFGPINVLCANAGITDESNNYPIWDMPLGLWEKTYTTNVQGTFLTIKHFLKSVENVQAQNGGRELSNVAVVVTGSETGVFGQAGHVEYASGKAGLQYGLVKSVKNEIVRLNGKARINAVAPGWVDTKLIEGRLDDPKELYREAQATVPLRKIAQPSDVARAAAFLASHRAAGHISGQCISVDGGMEGRIVWSEDEILQSSKMLEEKTLSQPSSSSAVVPLPSVPQTIFTPSKPLPKIKILVSVDFDAVSGWLGTGTHPDNNLADYSSGFFSAYVGVPRLLKLFRKLGIQDKVTWFVPMHSAESFPNEFKNIMESGCEIGLHGYCHEGAPQLTPDQERDVLEHCIDVCTSLTGRKPRGYRAPLYQLRESTIALLEEHGFLYDTSLSHHDSRPYYLPRLPTIQPPNFTAATKASEWMHPLPNPLPPTSKTLVEIPGNWYSEDMTPLQYWPHTANSGGYVDVRLVERMWMDRFEWIRSELGELDEGADMVFPLVLHPDTSGMAHVIGMLERVLGWLKGWEGEVEFCTFEQVAEGWKGRNSVV
ncbi:polysaccharide deacetylase family protein-like protein [Melanomma pulvis-pyrius CBS 109.77]|uniref:Polysaccharide deacetylase family protein-like protein n=1 Tax=Melanomma pulvis-pyrius CBS 109.77 TaxID=1314802 RepID=A0A6A6XNV6_9PLEO|nr:polysaccharide deacetylase family protein-like protein [Melanomma pulvis-pyrius CBS 109.77]